MLKQWWWWVLLLAMSIAVGAANGDGNSFAALGFLMALVWQAQHAWTYDTLMRLSDAHERARAEADRWRFIRQYFCLRPLEGHPNHRTIGLQSGADVRLVIDTSGPHIAGETLDEAIDWAIERRAAEDAAAEAERVDRGGVSG